MAVRSAKSGFLSCLLEQLAHASGSHADEQLELPHIVRAGVTPTKNGGTSHHSLSIDRGRLLGGALSSTNGFGFLRSSDRCLRLYHCAVDRILDAGPTLLSRALCRAHRIQRIKLLTSGFCRVVDSPFQVELTAMRSQVEIRITHPACKLYELDRSSYG